MIFCHVVASVLCPFLAMPWVGLNIIYSFSGIQHTKLNDIRRRVNEKDLTVSVSL